MEAACGAIAKPSERPFAAVESRKTGAAAAVSPSPSPPPVVRTRARWVKRPYVVSQVSGKWTKLKGMKGVGGRGEGRNVENHVVLRVSTSPEDSNLLSRRV